MSVSSGDEGGSMCEMNTTPLIDIMLVLLITLIVTLPPMTDAVKLDMPPPNLNQPPPTTQPEVINLDIYFDGAIAWNGQAVKTMDDLDSQFKAAAMENPQPEVHLSPDAHAKYDVVAQVLATAQRDHMEKIGFVNTSQFVQF
ncbi:MAG TPA: biopolymer transporter ExbD [Steroidobacteraceae bacterium]|nr:biopolymer transporter ExbD [Steroidobacteraceae bacterium]